MKGRWKRDPKETGRYKSFGTPAELRNWTFEQDGEALFFVSNVSSSHWSNDHSRQWQIWILAYERSICLKKRFDENQIEEAKEFAKNAYEAILENKDGRYTEMKDKIIALKNRRISNKTN